jgi:hypothetical protein
LQIEQEAVNDQGASMVQHKETIAHENLVKVEEKL